MVQFFYDGKRCVDLGALFDDDDNRAPLEAAFRLGVDMVNADRTILARSRLIVHIEKLGHGNSYKVSNKGKFGEDDIVVSTPSSIFFFAANQQILRCSTLRSHKVLVPV